MSLIGLNIGFCSYPKHEWVSSIFIYLGGWIRRNNVDDGLLARKIIIYKRSQLTCGTTSFALPLPFAFAFDFVFDFFVSITSVFSASTPFSSYR